MGLLTMHCYEEQEDHGDNRSVASLRTHRSTQKDQGSGIRLDAGATDHTASIYLLLVGRAIVQIGSDKIEMVKTESKSLARPLRYGDHIQLENAMSVHRSIPRPHAAIPCLPPFPAHHHGQVQGEGSVS